MDSTKVVRVTTLGDSYMITLLFLPQTYFVLTRSLRIILLNIRFHFRLIEYLSIETSKKHAEIMCIIKIYCFPGNIKI